MWNELSINCDVRVINILIGSIYQYIEFIKLKFQRFFSFFCQKIGLSSIPRWDESPWNVIGPPVKYSKVLPGNWDTCNKEIQSDNLIFFYAYWEGIHRPFIDHWDNRAICVPASSLI